MSKRYKKTDSDRVRTYAEVVSFGDDSSGWSWISISQLLSFFFGAIYLIFFILELEYVRFTNVYVFWAIYWAVGAFLFLCQLGGFIYLYATNSKDSPSDKPDGFAGAQFMKEVQWAFYFYIFWFIILTSMSAGWLVKFDKTISDSAPNVGVEPEWRVFNNLYNISATTTFIFLAITLRAVIGHFNPLRVITVWVKNYKSSNA